MSTSVFEVIRGVHPQYRGKMTRQKAVEILKEFDESLRRGLILRCTGVSTAIKFLEEHK